MALPRFPLPTRPCCRFPFFLDRRAVEFLHDASDICLAAFSSSSMITTPSLLTLHTITCFACFLLLFIFLDQLLEFCFHSFTYSYFCSCCTSPVLFSCSMNTCSEVLNRLHTASCDLPSSLLVPTAMLSLLLPLAQILPFSTTRFSSTWKRIFAHLPFSLALICLHGFASFLYPLGFLLAFR